MGAELATQQLVCSNCEELVNQHASRCPYCQCDLTTPFATRSQVAKEATQVIPLNPKICHLDPAHEEEEKKQEEAVAEEEGSLFGILVPLFCLLAGGAFLLFSLILKLFSRHGKLVLEWNASSWHYFFFPALFLLVVGLIAFSSDSSHSS
jgi:hypothetical protein